MTMAMISFRDKQLFTTEEAAVYLNYSDDSVIRRLILNKRLAATKFSRVWVITREELDRYKKSVLLS